jgi:hypothetical protein
VESVPVQIVRLARRDGELMLTTLQQLEEVQAAITAVMAGQSYTFTDSNGNATTVTRADLGKLTERETLLLDRYNTEQQGGSLTAFATFGRPSGGIYG